MDFDKDLQSIQEVRWLVAKAVVAQKELAKMSQQQVDGIAKAIADACAAQSERLAKMAVEETGFGIWQDKVLKNLLGSAITWDSVKDMKTVGIIKDQIHPHDNTGRRFISRIALIVVSTHSLLHLCAGSCAGKGNTGGIILDLDRNVIRSVAQRGQIGIHARYRRKSGAVSCHICGFCEGVRQSGQTAGSHTCLIFNACVFHWLMKQDVGLIDIARKTAHQSLDHTG